MSEKRPLHHVMPAQVSDTWFVQSAGTLAGWALPPHLLHGFLI